MPKKTLVDFESLVNELKGLLRRGPLNSKDACKSLNVSQSTFSRVIARSKNDVLVAGRAGRTVYALKRDVSEVGLSVPVYKVDENGKTSKLGVLHGIHPNGFFFEIENNIGIYGRFFDDLPCFMDDLRPNGFLGRLIPSTHPDLNLPKSISDWSANDCLKYLSRYGFDLIGNLIIGDEALDRYLNRSLNKAEYIKENERQTEYPKRSVEILQFGDPGSSAGGEQPKFPAIVGKELKSALVKFSPKVTNEISRRRADLLICEHLSLKTLERYGQPAASSTLIFGNDQVFLETERFDRIGERGRKGLISLKALSSEFIGKMGTWTECARELLNQKRISNETFDIVRWRELFGYFIGNTDMHLANISFYFDLEEILGLAPAYDMLPMLYAPQNEQVVERSLEPPRPGPADADIWKDVWTAGKDFWESVSATTDISSGFRKIAQINLGKIRPFEYLQNLLPQIKK